MTNNSIISTEISAYFPVLVFLIVAAVLSVIIVIIPHLLAVNKPDTNKLSSYECGFDAFSDARKKFDVKFYLVAIIFIIFDLEIAFLFPWAISLGNIGIFGFWSMIIFIVMLTIGFIYEWKKGALEWE